MRCTKTAAVSYTEENATCRKSVSAPRTLSAAAATLQAAAVAASAFATVATRELCRLVRFIRNAGSDLKKQNPRLFLCVQLTAAALAAPAALTTA